MRATVNKHLFINVSNWSSDLSVLCGLSQMPNISLIEEGASSKTREKYYCESVHESFSGA